MYVRPGLEGLDGGVGGAGLLAGPLLGSSKSVNQSVSPSHRGFVRGEGRGVAERQTVNLLPQDDSNGLGG